MCEEMIGSQKNNKEVKMGRKFRKPEYSFAAPIRTEVLQTRNHFKTITLDMPLGCHTERLEDDCFYPNASKRSLPFQEIATTSQAPDYYSPSAQNVNCPHADTIMLRELPPQVSCRLFVGRLGSCWFDTLGSKRRYLSVQPFVCMRRCDSWRKNTDSCSASTTTAS
jgi:hypothetical protein